MTRALRGAMPGLVAAALLGCDTLTGDEFWMRRVIGAIEFYADSAHLEVPSSAERGAEFQVKIRTYGGGCTSQGKTEVVSSGLRAEVTPYDVEFVRPRSACTDELRLFTHEARLTFAEGGTATVVIRGRKEPQGTVLRVERTIRVQ